MNSALYRQDLEHPLPRFFMEKHAGLGTTLFCARKKFRPINARAAWGSFVQCLRRPKIARRG